MKILQINAVNNQLSTGQSAREFDAAVRECGHTSVIAYASGVSVNADREYRIGTSADQKLHALLSRMTGLQGYYSGMATKKFLQYIDEYGPDIVVLRNLHANYIHLPKLLRHLAKRDIPTVAVLHDCWFYTGKCCHYTVEGCYRWQNNCGACPAKKKYNKSWFFDRSKKMLQDKKNGFSAIPRLGVVAVSDWLLQEAQRAPVFQNAVCIRRIYNWVDSNVFRPEAPTLRGQYGIENKKVILCAASIWSHNKGLQTALAVARHLKEDEVLVLVGEIPQNTALPENVVYIPRTEDMQQLARIYNMADVFMQPSLEETFGKVTAEALACGVPVVCFDSTANPELIGPGCGTVVPAGDREKLLLAVREILKTGRQTYSHTCREYALTHFACTRNMQQYMQLFEMLQKPE